MPGKEIHMRILVTYYSTGGNTKKVADAIYEALEKEDRDIKPITEVDNTEDYSLIFLGFPIHGHSVPVAVHNFIKNIKPGVSLVLFATHSSHKDSRLSREAVEHALSLSNASEVLGSFTCRGGADPEVLDRLKEKPEHREWASSAYTALSHPDESDLEDAKEFARDMLSKARKFEKHFL